MHGCQSNASEGREKVKEKKKRPDEKQIQRERTELGIKSLGKNI